MAPHWLYPGRRFQGLCKSLWDKLQLSDSKYRCLLSAVEILSGQDFQKSLPENFVTKEQQAAATGPSLKETITVLIDRVPTKNLKSSL